MDQPWSMMPECYSEEFGFDFKETLTPVLQIADVRILFSLAATQMFYIPSSFTASNKIACWITDLIAWMSPGAACLLYNPRTMRCMKPFKNNLQSLQHKPQVPKSFDSIIDGAATLSQMNLLHVQHHHHNSTAPYVVEWRFVGFGWWGFLFSSHFLHTKLREKETVGSPATGDSSTLNPRWRNSFGWKFRYKHRPL